MHIIINISFMLITIIMARMFTPIIICMKEWINATNIISDYYRHEVRHVEHYLVDQI